MTSTQVFVGVDISKAQLDLALRPEGQFSVPNNEAGFAQVLEHLNAVHPTLVVLEATGGLELPLTGVLAAAGVPVVVVNPRQVRDFAKATGRLAKTDALDAQMLAHWAKLLACSIPTHSRKANVTARERREGVMAGGRGVEAAALQGALQELASDAR